MLQNSGAAFAQGVFDALGKRPFSIEGGIGVRSGAKYASGYLYVSQSDIDALGYMEAILEDMQDHHEMIQEQRKAFLQ